MSAAGPSQGANRGGPINSRAARRRVDGVLLLDKPTGLTSNAALQRARRLLNAEKAGHTGTLDPLASGLLPLCFGEATKFARFLLDADKRYRATVRFGVTTTTQDAEGDVMETRPVTVDRAQLEAALPAFIGALRQTPPAYSALKFQGRNYYEYARAGIEIPRPARDVRIELFALTEWSCPDATFDIVCGKGTYVRGLAADLGAALRCGAHLIALRRIASGGFAVADALSLDVLEASPPETRDARLLPVDCLLAELPRIDVDGDAAARLADGRSIAAPELPADRFRAYDRAGRLLGVLRRAGAELAPERMARTRAEDSRPSAGVESWP
jgi:tRNA pseudouridine55 synthase